MSPLFFRDVDFKPSDQRPGVKRRQDEVPELFDFGALTGKVVNILLCPLDLL